MTATVTVVNASHIDLRLPYACGFIHVGPCLGGRPRITRDVPAAAWLAWSSIPANAEQIAAGLVYAVQSPAPVAA
jgi:hypothetical protein